MKRVIFYHDDADGRCAAAIAGRYMQPRMEIEYIARWHPDAPPWELLTGEIDEVMILDYSFEAADMLRLLELVGIDHFIWIDHHETSLRKLKDFHPDHRYPGLRCSGIAACMLTWEFCALYIDPERLEAPWPVCYIADRDVWKFEHGDNTLFFYEMYLQEENAHPCSELWDRYLNMDEDEAVEYVQGGRILRKARIRGLEKTARRFGYVEYSGVFRHFTPDARIYKLNYPGSGDMGQVIKDMGYDVAWCYHDVMKNDRLVRIHSLYSNTVDVGEIAASLHGGGHRGASGWTEFLD